MWSKAQDNRLVPGESSKCHVVCSLMNALCFLFSRYSGRVNVITSDFILKYWLSRTMAYLEEEQQTGVIIQHKSQVLQSSPERSYYLLWNTAVVWVYNKYINL